MVIVFDALMSGSIDLDPGATEVMASSPTPTVSGVLKLSNNSLINNRDEKQHLLS